MSKPIILANESLVLNGSFEYGFKDWKKGPINDDWLGTGNEFYEGEWIRFLRAGNESSVSQPLTVPKDPGAQARYALSFLCEMRHTEAGRLVISIVGQSETQEILLLPGEPRDLEEDQARLKSGQPLELKPIKYEVDLDLPFNGQDTLTVSVFSPANNPGDYISQVCITRIKILLHLGPVAMQGWTLDEEPLRETGPLYLCLGASASLPHRLRFVLEPDNVWMGTQAALISEDNPQGAIGAAPGWGVDQPLDSLWVLDCPSIGDQEPYRFNMNLVNRYNADPYPMAVSLGHHRLVFRDWQDAAYYPVLEHEQSVRLGVQVASYYTGQVLNGRTVNWTIAGQGVKGATLTDDQGWAYFDYEPTDKGTFVIEASVESLYYAVGVETHSFDVWVLETDPWNDVLAVVEGKEFRWEAKTGYPNRGSDYPVNVKLALDSPLLGTELSLLWSGESHEQLGVVVSPALEEQVPVTGAELAWTLTNEDRLDGLFQLSLRCSKLLRPSPEKRMSLARNLVRVGEVREANKFPVVDEQESVLLRVQAVHVVVNAPGDPVVNALVKWVSPKETVDTVTGEGGWASYLYTPKDANEHVVTATLKAHEDAVGVEQPFTVKPMATSPWKNQVNIFLDGVEVDRVALGVLCRRGQTHTLKVIPVSGSTWVGKNISLHWRGEAPAIGLVPSNIGAPEPLLATGVEWTLTSPVDTSISSLFELELRLEGVSSARELFGRLMSMDLTQEMQLKLDQVSAEFDRQELYPCLGTFHRFNVLPKALSPLVGLMSSLTWTGTPADQLGATVEPDLNSPQAISDGGAIWTLDFTESPLPGKFALTLALPQLDFIATAKPMALAHNKVRIEAWRESPVDPVVGQEPAWLWAQVFSHFTQRAVDQVPVTWTASGGPSVVTTDADGWSGFAFLPTTATPRELQVEALVTSPYDDFIDRRSMMVTSLPSDPWQGLTVSFDGQLPQPWGQKTYFPRRKGEHTIDLAALPDSPLFGHDLTLGMTGTGPAELDIRFLSDGLGMPRKFYDVGLQYQFMVGDLKDGSFALRLSSQRLASLSPANAMSLGEGSQVLKIIANSSVYQTLDWGQELVEQVTVVSAISGKPMEGWIVTWSHPDLGDVSSVTNYLGVAEVRFIPTTPETGELIATVGEGLHSVSVSLPYFLNHPREIQALSSPTPIVPEGTRVSAVVTVGSAMTGEPLQDVEVMWDFPGVTLPPSRTDDEGIAEVSFLFSSVRRGLLEATVRGGYGGWDVKHIEFKLKLNSSESKGEV